MTIIINNTPTISSEVTSLANNFTAANTFSGALTTGLKVSGTTANGSSIFAGSTTVTSQNLVLVANDNATGNAADAIQLKCQPNTNAILTLSGNGTAADQLALRLNNGAVLTIGDAISNQKKITSANNTLDDGTNGAISIKGGLTFAGITPKSSGSPYTVLAADYAIVVTTGAGGYTVTLPAATGSGRQLVIIKADSGAGAVTVSRAGADTIEGATSVSLATQYKKSVLLDGASAVWYDLSASLV